jgi:hypothetical protein
MAIAKGVPKAMRVSTGLPLVLFLLLLTFGARGQTSTLNFTHPDTGQNVETVFDSTAMDSVRQVECGPGGPIHHLEKSYLWRYETAVHKFARVDSQSAVGLEGLPGRYTIAVTGSYYVTTRNNVGESCAPDHPVTVIVDSLVTSVPIADAPGAPVEVRIFNVHGQLVPEGTRRASGIYFFEARWRSGLITRGKLPAMVR